MIQVQTFLFSPFWDIQISQEKNGNFWTVAAESQPPTKETTFIATPETKGLEFLKTIPVKKWGFYSTNVCEFQVTITLIIYSFCWE